MSGKESQLKEHRHLLEAIIMQCITREKIIIYGGVNREGDMLGDLWEFNLNTITWTNIVTGKNSPDVLLHGYI